MAIKKESKTKLLITIGLVFLFGLLILFLLYGDNFDLLIRIFRDDLTNDELQDTLRDFGMRGYITVAILAMLQVICTFLPAEPVQVLSGLTFGFPVGLLCCWVGVFLGNTVIFLLQKTYGDRLRSYFMRKLHLDLDKIAQSSKCIVIIFILYFLPAIPYGMICFFAASIGMKYRRYIAITMLGSLPSVCIGVGLGYMAIASNWIVSLCVFAVLIIMLVVMAINRNKLFEMVNNFADKRYSAKTKVQEMNYPLLNFAFGVVRIYYFFKGIRIHSVNKCTAPIQGPAIVLCSHGSFSDYVYAGKLLKKYKPNFIAARLYFYHKLLGTLLKSVGSFPKSMFAIDVESTKNSLTVLKNGGILGMMPEARLSTAGRFEDIQPGTFSFLKKSAVPIYTLRFQGDYLSHPKWGNGLRRGSFVEAVLEPLYTAEQVQELSVEQIQAGVEDRLYYDDFQWLASHPKQRYRTKRLAEGLENVLMLCPKCGRKHTLTAKKREISCEYCGKLTTLGDRYDFDPAFRFRHPGQWYDWQKSVLEEQIRSDSNYTLQDTVELRLPGNGKTMTRSAGRGTCTLNREGLRYRGTRDGEDYEIFFSIQQVYRLLFGAGENFEVYNGTEILYFVPEEKRSNVDWYLASMILNDMARASQL